jgi:uridylate kinase
VLKATKVDGIYSADPKLESDASLYESVSYDRVIEGKLRVMDANAIVLCRDQEMPIRVFNVFEEGNLKRLVRGEPIGSLVR